MIQRRQGRKVPCKRMDGTMVGLIVYTQISAVMPDFLLRFCRLLDGFLLNFCDSPLLIIVFGGRLDVQTKVKKDASLLEQAVFELP